MQDWDGLYASGARLPQVGDDVIAQIIATVDARAPHTFLDVGCGAGEVCAQLYDHGWDGLGVDVSAVAVARAAAAVEGVQFRQADVDGGGLADLPDGWGLVVSKHVYAFLDDGPAFLRQAERLVHRDGRVAIVTPTFEHSNPALRGIAVSGDRLVRDAAPGLRLSETRELPLGTLLVFSPVAAAPGS